MRREWPLERDGETLQYGFCIRHHGLNDILRRPDVVDEADTLPGQPGHLLPIAVGVGGRQEHVELAHFCLLPEKYRPPDHRKTVADSWDLSETVRPFMDHPVAQQGVWPGRIVEENRLEEVDLALDPGDLRQRLTKIHLRMARIVPQRHVYFAMPQPPRQHIVFHNADPAGVAMLVAKPFEDPLRGMPLLLRPAFILSQDTVDDPSERVELRTCRRPAPPVPGRHRKRQHLRDRPRIDPK